MKNISIQQKIKQKNSIFRIVSAKNKAVFIRNLSLMLKSGLSITETLDILGEQKRGKWQKIIKEIKNSVFSGNTLFDSLSVYPHIFDAFILNAVRAGEISGTLEENLLNVAEEMDRTEEIKNKIRNALIYPVIVLIISFVLGLIIAFVVLPKITPLFKGLKIDLPLSTRFLIAFAGTVNNHGLAIFLSIVLFILVVSWILRRRWIKPFTHLIFLYLPFVGSLTKTKNLSLFAHALGALLRSGISIDEALEISERTLNNYYYRKIIEKSRLSVQNGFLLSESLSENTRLFPRMMVSLIKVGETSGNLEEELRNIAAYQAIELDQKTKFLTTVFEPFLLICIGLIVAGLALAIITPIYQITGNIR